jgi:endonuclease/exonuclease/phosphatase family metal-dependent hydrolase
MLPLKIISWNIEHFNGTGGQDKSNRTLRLQRVEKVAQFIAAQSPDIFGLSEVEGALVYEKFTQLLPEYTFNITEGRQSQEILIGVRNNLTAFFTQRNEFKRNNPYLRPGALLTVRSGNIHIPILFTHLKSMPSPEGFGLRDAMFEKIFKLRLELNKAERALNGVANANANFVVVGDMNTMGMDYYSKDHDIPMDREIKTVKRKFKNRKMTALVKTHPHTFFNGSASKYPPSELDHVFAAAHLQFEDVDTAGANLIIGGWAEKTTNAEKDIWINEFSDHAPLIFKIISV